MVFLRYLYPFLRISHRFHGIPAIPIPVQTSTHGLGVLFRVGPTNGCRPAIAKGRHSEGPLWYRVRVSDWRTFTMTALRYGRPKPSHVCKAHLACPTHISADVQRITLNASSCMTISCRRTEQLVIIAGLQVFCRVTGFTSDFLSFIVVEHIRFFHGAIRLSVALHVWSNAQLTKCALHIHHRRYFPSASQPKPTLMLQ